MEIQEYNAHLVDIDCIRFLPLSLPLLLVTLCDCLGSFTRLDSSLSRSLRRHDGSVSEDMLVDDI